MALATAFTRRATGFCVPLNLPSSREGGRAEEGRMTLSRQRRQLGRWSPRLPSLSAVTIVALNLPPFFSIIAITTSLPGCNTTTRTLAGEEGGAPASAPASTVEIEPASAVVGGGGTGSLLQLLWGGRVIPPPPLAANRRTPQRQRRRRRRRQHGGEHVGRENGGHRNCAIVVPYDR